MSFRIQKATEPKFVCVPVIIPEPIDGGEVAKHQVRVTYLIPHKEEVDGLLQEPDAVELMSKLPERYVVRIDDVQDEDGQPIVYRDARSSALGEPNDPHHDPLARQIRDQILNLTYARGAISETFWALSRGERIKARQKN